MRLVDEVHKAVANTLHEGDVVIDATVGNGLDTLFLAQQVGQHGCVYGFDIQAAAIATTAQRLQQQGAQVKLLQQGHETMLQAIPRQHHGQVKAVLFNLGYLPGADKTIVTQIDTTEQALKQATQLLASHAVISVLSYTAHQQGYDEFLAVQAWFDGLKYDQWLKHVINQEDADQGVPVWFLVQKR
jgi:16S rRNA C1402 N4-methylase RsmH